jgi:hypothetical protein
MSSPDNHICEDAVGMDAASKLTEVVKVAINRSHSLDLFQEALRFLSSRCLISQYTFAMTHQGQGTNTQWNESYTRRVMRWILWRPHLLHILVYLYTSPEARTMY